jgi:hypothetical protein
MKNNKITVVVGDTPEERTNMVAAVAVSLGFARTRSDAKKIVRALTTDFDINSAYFILAATHNFNYSPIKFEMLYRLAALGICVVIGTRKIPNEFVELCNVLYATDFAKL